ncbi:MAG: hypothetical protein AAFX53_18740 [Bacteroidota bacterium]
MTTTFKKLPGTEVARFLGPNLLGKSLLEGDQVGNIDNLSIGGSENIRADLDYKTLLS